MTVGRLCAIFSLSVQELYHTSAARQKRKMFHFFPCVCPIIFRITPPCRFSCLVITLSSWSCREEIYPNFQPMRFGVSRVIESLQCELGYLFVIVQTHRPEKYRFTDDTCANLSGFNLWVWLSLGFSGSGFNLQAWQLDQQGCTL